MAGTQVGNRNKKRGTRIEREFVNKLKEEGIPAWRVPLSGAIGGPLNSDIKIGPQKEWDVEVKGRKGGAGFTQIEKWLKGNEFLFLKRNHADPMVTMEWKVFVDLMKTYLDYSEELDQRAHAKEKEDAEGESKASPEGTSV